MAVVRPKHPVSPDEQHAFGNSTAQKVVISSNAGIATIAGQKKSHLRNLKRVCCGDSTDPGLSRICQIGR